MKTMLNRITLHFICIVIFPLCLLALSGCAGPDSKYIVIVSPADISSFESGDSITFEMLLTVYSRASAVIKKGTIIQWTSDRDGDFWREEVDHDIAGVKSEWGLRYTASYSQSFSTSALSAGDHKITCKADTTDESGTYNIATASIRIYITESQNTTTTTIATTTTAAATTTTTDGGGNLDVTACTALDYLEVRAGEPEYWNNKSTCLASIILKNNGTRGILAVFYVESTLASCSTGWHYSYLVPGQEWNSETIPFWAYQPDIDGSIRTIKTTKATAVYYYMDDDDSDKGCEWIVDDYNSDGVIDAPIRTRDISGLDPCN